MQKNQFLKIKNSLLELEKDFTDVKDIELKDRELKIKREIELFFKPIFVSIGDTDRFGEEMKKKVFSRQIQLNKQFMGENRN